MPLSFATADNIMLCLHSSIRNVGPIRWGKALGYLLQVRFPSSFITCIPEINSLCVNVCADHVHHIHRWYCVQKTAESDFLTVNATIVTLALVEMGVRCHECRYNDLLRSFLLSLPFGFILMCLANIGIFHGINNFSAELTKFADRLFYTVSRTGLGCTVWAMHACLPFHLYAGLVD